MNRSAGIMVLSFLLAGCSASASGPRFLDTSFATQSVTDDKARVIFYRESDHNFPSVTLGIDDSIVGALAQNGFIVADIVPGDHRVSAWLQHTPIGEFAMKIRVLPGETHYIRPLAVASACSTRYSAPWSSLRILACPDAER